MKMLVLSRKKNESIVIGTGPTACRIMVVDIRGDKVRLGIEAPRDVPVHRWEVAEAIQWEAGPAGEWPACAICKCPLHGVDADASGVAHRVCAERELSS
jgi:carbon storage regulator